MNTHSHSQYQADFTFFRPKPDGDIDPAGEAGWYMQRERERRGLSLEQAGEQCNIHARHLNGIEHGDLTQLPSRSEALALIGQYAGFLGFDPQPLVQHYAQFLPQPIATKRSAHRRKPRPFSSAKIFNFPSLQKVKSMGSGAGGIVASVFAAVLVFEAGIYVFSSSGETKKSPVEQLAAVETEPLPIGAGKAPPAGAAKSSADGRIVSSINTMSEAPLNDDGSLRELAKEADQSAGTLSGLTELIESDLTKVKIPIPKAKPVLKPKAATAAKVKNVAKPDTKASGRTFGTDNKGARLVLTAKENVWVRIEDRSGNVVMTQTLRKGDRYNVPARDGLVVITRDGGLLGYTIDGKPMGTLGERGEILVGRPLDLNALANSRG